MNKIMESYYCFVAEQDTELYIMPEAVLDEIFGENPVEKLIHNIFNMVKLMELRMKEVLEKH